MTALSSIKQILIQIKPELKRKKLLSTIGLFWSIVKNDFSEQSGVDIIVDLGKPISIDFIDFADCIESMLNKPVDLFSRNGIKPKYFNAIEPEIIYF